MIQHSPEWHAHRARHFNASEAGAVMGVNPWSPKNPAELYDLKTGALVIPETPAMRRGTQMEPEARAHAERHIGLVLTPAVLTRDRYSASLDGIDFADTWAVEIKCPGEASKLWGLTTAADLREHAPHYWWQLVHQHYVAGFARLLFLVYSPERQVAIDVRSDELAADRDALIGAWERFGEALDKGERPAGDERTDAEWLAAAEDYRAAKAAEAVVTQRVEDAKKRLIALAGEASAKGGGVSVIKATRKGSVDLKAAEAAGVDLGAYKKPDSFYFMVK